MNFKVFNAEKQHFQTNLVKSELSVDYMKGIKYFMLESVKLLAGMLKQHHTDVRNMYITTKKRKKNLQTQEVKHSDEINSREKKGKNKSDVFHGDCGINAHFERHKQIKITQIQKQRLKRVLFDIHPVGD
jgi:hypothetical protein